MSERDRAAGSPVIAGEESESILPPDTSLLDLVDNVLSKGVVVQGELILGLAGIDLVFVGVHAILCSADRILPRRPRDR